MSMMRVARVALLLLPLAACTGMEPFVADTATIPAGAMGGGLDPDMAALNHAQWAFADSSRTYGKPIEAARAALAMDYLAGQLNSSPRWGSVSALTKQQLLEGRAEVRAALGVAPGATSQQVVDGLAGASVALAAGDQALAVRALSTPVFPAGGLAVLAALADMPYLRMANVSTMRAANELFDSGTDERL